MLNLALWLKKNNFRLDQVQAFLPTPLAIASAMYHTGKNPLKGVKRNSEPVSVVRGGKQRRLHKAFLRYHDPHNWPLLREALKKMGRADLIGNGKRHLVPSWQPEASEHGKKSGPRSAGSTVKRNKKKIAGKSKTTGKSNKKTSGKKKTAKRSGTRRK